MVDNLVMSAATGEWIWKQIHGQSYPLQHSKQTGMFFVMLYFIKTSKTAFSSYLQELLSRDYLAEVDGTKA